MSRMSCLSVQEFRIMILILYFSYKISLKLETINEKKRPKPSLPLINPQFTYCHVIGRCNYPNVTVLCVLSKKRSGLEMQRLRYLRWCGTSIFQHFLYCCIRPCSTIVTTPISHYGTTRQKQTPKVLGCLKTNPYRLARLGSIFGLTATLAGVGY